MRIGLLAYPGCLPAGLFAFADMLHAANRRSAKRLFETHFVALRAGTVACAHGADLQVGRSLEPDILDALLIPGFWAESAQQVEAVIAAQRPLIAALAKCPQTLKTWAYCSGVGLLAASGRLDGRAATTTWWLAEAMARSYPKVKWQCERDIVTGRQTVTAGGVNGHFQIAHALVERCVSPAVFRDLVRLMVLPRPVQPHAAFRSMSLIQQGSELLRRLHVLVERMPAERVTVKALSEQLAMSERTLARKVSDETGVAVASYVRRIKLNQVSERLMLTTAPVSSIGAELGFSSESNLRRMFKEMTRMTPLEYRQRFARR